MRKQDRECVRRDVGRGLFYIVDAEEMRVVDPGEADLLAFARDRLGFVQQHSYPHVFERRNHADRVMIAEDAVNRPFEAGAHPGDAFQRGLESAISLAPIIAGQNANVIFEPADKRDETVHRRPAHVGVQIAQMKDGEALERLRQPGRGDGVAAQLDAPRVPAGARVKPGEPKRAANEGRGQNPVFEMEEIQPLAERLRLMIRLDADPLAGVHFTQTTLEPRHDVAFLQDPSFVPAPPIGRARFTACFGPDRKILLADACPSCGEGASAPRFRPPELATDHRTRVAILAAATHFGRAVFCAPGALP